MSPAEIKIKRTARTTARAESAPVETETPAAADVLSIARARAARTARRTWNKQVVHSTPGVTGLFALDAERFPNPILAAATGHVGSKLRIAAELGLHSTVGADLVNRCVNDIAAQGAVPLFFFDTIASGITDPAVVEAVVGGIADACRTAGCVLLGGDVAAVPEVYTGDAYDLSGVLVGAVSRGRLLAPETIQPGDILIGLPSNGLHTSGYDLAQELLFGQARYAADQYVNELRDKVGAALMRGHRSYLNAVRKLIQADLVTAFAHITDGGLSGDLTTILPRGLGLHFDHDAWQPGPIFDHLERLGTISREEMLRTFNMGVGMVAVVPPAHLAQARLTLNRMNERHMMIGRVTKADRRVIY